MYSVTTLKDRGITVQSYEYHPEWRKNIHEPEVILVTLVNTRGETFQAKTYCAGKKHVLRSDEYIQLVLDVFNEIEEEYFHRCWQWQKWGDPVWMLSPRLAQPKMRLTNEFDYYHYVPSWYDHNVKKPLEAFQNRFIVFVEGMGNV